MSLGRPDGRPVLAALAIIGVAAAMIGATVLVYTTQALGSSSQRVSQAATTTPAPLAIDTAYVRVEQGEPVEIHWLIEAGPGGALRLEDIALRIETAQSTWQVKDARGATVVRDPDGSVAVGDLDAGDIILWVTPIVGPLPAGAPGTATVSAGGEATSFLLNVPPLRGGDHLSPLRIA